MDILTTSGIENTVSSYIYNEQSKQITPLNNRKVKYQNLSDVWGNLSSKMDSLKSILKDLKTTGTGSFFIGKSIDLSTSNFFTATAASSASLSAYSLRVNQLAKSDILVSQTMASAAAVPALSAGTYRLQFASGDNSAQVDVNVTGTETYQDLMKKISDAVNQDTGILSAKKTAADAYTGGTSTFTIDVNGTQKSVTVNGGGTYDQLMDELVSNINTNVTGVKAEKVTDGTNVQLKLTSTTASNYLSISSSSGFDLASDLNIAATKEVGASALLSASSFTPSSGNSKLSFTAKNSGFTNRLVVTDAGGLLSNIGLSSSILSGRTKNATDDDAGFILSTGSDTSTNNNLNSKILFNGLSIQRDSNTISDLAAGVTFNLKAVMQNTDPDVNVSVTKDLKQSQSKIEAFISNFNAVYTYVKSRTAVDKTFGRGVLAGDSTASAILSTFYNEINAPVSGIQTGNLNMLNQIGLAFDPTNGLSIKDQSKLTSKMTDSMDQVEALFNSTNGIANILYDTVDSYTGTAGTLSKLKSSLDTNITDISNKITSTQTRIDKSAEVLRKRYQQLQSQLASLLTTSSWFSSSNSGSYF